MSFISTGVQPMPQKSCDLLFVATASMGAVEEGIFTQCMHTAGITRSGTHTIYLSDLKENLLQTILSYNPRVVVTIDDAPLHKVTGYDSAFKYRGSPIVMSDYTVIPIIRPSMATQVFINRYFIISDLRKAIRFSEGTESIPVRTLIINPSYHEVLYYLQDIIDHTRTVAFDIECCNQEVSCIAFATSPTMCMSIPMLGNCWTEMEEYTIWRLIDNILHSTKIAKIAQNAMFDISFLARQNNIITRGPIDDTMIGHNYIYKDFPKGLDFLCSIYTNEPYYKDDGKIWKTPEKDINKFYLYNAKDAAVTFECWEKIRYELLTKGFMEFYKREIMENFTPMLYAQLRGMATNHVALQESKKRVIADIDTLQAELTRMCGFPLNPVSSKQCKEYFYITKEIKPYVSRKTGAITTDDDAMLRIARKGYREAAIIRDIRGKRKLVSTYLDIAFDSDSRLRSSYNLAGTSSGRLSSSQTIFGTGCNFQNIPPEFKTFLIADPGHILIEFDKVQAEWIVVAYLANDANMIEVVEKKQDAHVKTASLMFGVPEELIKIEAKALKDVSGEHAILAARKEHCPDILKYNPIASMSCRQIGKKCNHGLNYDLGYKGFAMAADIGEKESKHIVEMYHRTYPGIRNTFHDRIRTQLSKNRTITNCFGRKRIFMDRWGDDLFKAAYAQIPQSSVGDMVNIAIPAIYNDDVFYMKKVDFLGQVHDSILIQYPIDNLSNLCNTIKTCIEYLDIPMTYSGRTFIIPTDVKIGTSWGNMTKVSDININSVNKILQKYIGDNDVN